jgi:predicted tellurium resistance membrane protein TerC
VKTPPKAAALTLGIVGTLIFGLGLTMILEWSLAVWGAIVAMGGILPLALAYPLYKWLFKKLQDKHREEILKLSEEILNEEKDA